MGRWEQNVVVIGEIKSNDQFKTKDGNSSQHAKGKVTWHGFVLTIDDSAATSTSDDEEEEEMERSR